MLWLYLYTRELFTPTITYFYPCKVRYLDPSTHVPFLHAPHPWFPQPPNSDGPAGLVSPALGAVWVSFPWYMLPEHKSFSFGATPVAWLVDPTSGSYVAQFHQFHGSIQFGLWHRRWSSLLPYSGFAKLVSDLQVLSVGFIWFRKSYRGFAPPMPVCISPCNPSVTQMLPEPSSARGALVWLELQVIEPDLSMKIHYRNTSIFVQIVASGIRTWYYSQASLGVRQLYHYSKSPHLKSYSKDSIHN
jgi:hypothetical protein